MSAADSSVENVRDDDGVRTSRYATERANGAKSRVSWSYRRDATFEAELATRVPDVPRELG